MPKLDFWGVVITGIIAIGAMYAYGMARRNFPKLNLPII
ncbi:hypothetical protein ES707_13398 [subsurface metagenome]